MWLSVNKNGDEWLFSCKPERRYDIWDCYDGENYFIPVPKGTILRLLDYPLTWDDECEEIIEYSNN